MKQLTTTCAVILILGTLAQAQQATSMSAQEILDRVASVYASCRSYSDEGEVSTNFVNLTFSTPRDRRFVTAFVRPSSFRFELSLNGRSRSPVGRYIAWKGVDQVKSWSPFGTGATIEGALDLALIGFARFSGGSSVTIPPLLLPNLFRLGPLLTSLDELRVVGEEKIDGRQTFRIESKFQGQPLKLWIDKNEFLIIKIYRRVDLGGGFVEESTTKYKPQVNVDIAPDKLTFNPPSSSRATKAAAPDSASSAAPAPTATVRPQPAAEEAPGLRDFGSSLSRSSKENAERRKAKRSHADEDVVRVDTDLVLCDVLVVDGQGKAIGGLRKEDFVIKEDDKLQGVGSFSLGDSKTVPRSIVLIIDYSGSQLPYIKTSIEATKTLVDKLNPRDKMALVTDDVKLLADFTNDKQLLKQRLDSLKASALMGKLGRSDQYDALQATLNELFDEEDLRPIIIFQTDGDQLSALKGGTITSSYLPPRRYGLEDLMTAAEKARATIYSIIPGIQFVGLPEAEQLKRAKVDWENREEAMKELRRLDNQPPQNNVAKPSDESLNMHAARWRNAQLALTGLAQYTGGWADFLEQPDQADVVYTRVLNDINKRYVIGYYPTNRTRDGKRRKVSVEVRGHPEYIVWGRKTYFSPDPE